MNRILTIFETATQRRREQGRAVSLELSAIWRQEGTYASQVEGETKVTTKLLSSSKVCICVKGGSQQEEDEVQLGIFPHTHMSTSPSKCHTV
jgi:hypothetical protein